MIDAFVLLWRSRTASILIPSMMEFYKENQLYEDFGIIVFEE